MQGNTLKLHTALTLWAGLKGQILKIGRFKYVLTCVALAKAGQVVGPLPPSVCPSVRTNVSPQHFLGA